MCTSASHQGVVTSKPPPAQSVATATTLEQLGPSPKSRFVRARVRHAVWDLLQLLCVCAVSLYVFASVHKRSKALLPCAPTGDGNASSLGAHCPSLGARATAVWAEAAADPVEAACCCFTNFFLLSMSGNSPLAWAVVFGFSSVDANTFTAFSTGVLQRWGGADGLAPYVFGLYSLGVFVVLYVVHGLLLLPLEVWQPAIHATEPYKIQPLKRVDASQIPRVAAVCVADLLCIGVPYIMAITHVSVLTRGKWGVSLDTAGLPPFSERAWMLIAHLIVNELVRAPTPTPRRPHSHALSPRRPSSLPPLPLLSRPPFSPSRIAPSGLSALLLLPLGAPQGKPLPAHP